MKAGFSLFLTVVAILGASWAPAQADLYDFTIQGTYAETLTAPDPTDPTGTVTLFTDGDAFTIQGTYDTAVPPALETKGNGNVPLVGFSISYPTIPYLKELRYASITDPTFASLDLINQYYPSDGSGNNDFEAKRAAYTSNFDFLYGPQFSNDFGVHVYDDYTNLHVSESISHLGTSRTGYIDYNYHIESTESGPLTITGPAHDTLDLNITSIEITDHVVPLPSSVILLASAMATVAGFRKKLRNKESV